MVWPFKSGSKKDGEDQEPTRTTPNRSSAPKKDQPLLLEDTEPRFNNGPADPQSPLKEAVKSIKTDDFKFQNLVAIPCLRNALMTGISSMGVLGIIIFIAQKNPSKAANWGVGGFFLGSTISWEQCRYRRRKELEFAEKAKEAVAKKGKPMLHDPKEKLTDVHEKSRDEVKSWWKRS